MIDMKEWIVLADVFKRIKQAI